MIHAECDRRHEAWLDSETPFDFTGESYLEECLARPQTGQMWEVELEIDAKLDNLRDLRTAVVLDRGVLELCRDVDEAAFEDDGLWDRFPAVLTTDTGTEALAAGRLIAERDPMFWPRLRKLGPTPELIRQANAILSDQEFTPETRQRKRSATVTIRRRTCTRARSSRRTAPGRHQGSRRTPSRSAGGGSSGDDDGESEPPRLVPRWQHGDSRPLAEAYTRADVIERYFDNIARGDLARFMP